MDRKTALVALLGCCLFLSGARWARADDVNDAANPYSIIPERNVFHLNPPPPPPPPPETTKADLPIIKITGIVRIGDQLRALFVQESKDKKDTTPTYYNLAAGERQGILEVVKIDPVGQKVDVINSGKSTTLTVKDDSLAKSEGSPAAGAVNGTNPATGPRQFPQFPSFNNRRTPPPAFPGATVPGSAAPGPASPFPVPMRTRRTTYGAPQGQ